MRFDINKSLQVLERTPDVLYALLHGISKDWTLNNEGINTWSAFDVVGHLVYCDTANWLLRAKHILKEKDAKPLPAFDRYAQFALNVGKPVDDLLSEFRQVRSKVLQEIKDLQLEQADLHTKGLHPEFGTVRLSQLFSAWVVHDLSHLSQASRVMAKQYQEEVGPWIQYLRILK
jgi:hypothetical protein